MSKQSCGDSPPLDVTKPMARNSVSQLPRPPPAANYAVEMLATPSSSPRKRPRTSADFLQFCDFVLEYAGYDRPQSQAPESPSVQSPLRFSSAKSATSFSSPSPSFAFSSPRVLRGDLHSSSHPTSPPPSTVWSDRGSPPHSPSDPHSEASPAVARRPPNLTLALSPQPLQVLPGGSHVRSTSSSSVMAMQRLPDATPETKRKDVIDYVASLGSHSSLSSCVDAASDGNRNSTETSSPNLHHQNQCEATKERRSAAQANSPRLRFASITTSSASRAFSDHPLVHNHPLRYPHDPDTPPPETSLPAASPFIQSPLATCRFSSAAAVTQLPSQPPISPLGVAMTSFSLPSLPSPSSPLPQYLHQQQLSRQHRLPPRRANAVEKKPSDSSITSVFTRESSMDDSPLSPSASSSSSSSTSLSSCRRAGSPTPLSTDVDATSNGNCAGGNNAYIIQCKSSDGKKRTLKVEDGDDDANSVTCFCRKPFAGRPMVECDSCATWFHLSCVKLKKSSIPDVWNCQQCPEKVG